MIDRLQGMPTTLPDLFGWIEAGVPGLHPAPGVHGIRIEESLTDGTYSLRAELPGMDAAKHIDITVADGVLTLRAERAAVTPDKHHSEFRYGTFARAVRLPAGARGDEASADYKDGILTVTVPVPEGKTASRAIPVRHI
ncbi:MULTISPECIES: Hsp20/alpha crystallin family protein [unclassified Streptomyces]|uniref:Hsp20/alpha crystallin family protein n=1 Tax=Streptomyces sp. SYP-A7185 TaxID=3040076 RepID=UPI0038F69730